MMMIFGLKEISSYPTRRSISRGITQVFQLAQGVVYTIYQDRAGHMWFGTEGDGVVRYDGRTSKTFTRADGLAGNTVYNALC